MYYFIETAVALTISLLINVFVVSIFASGLFGKTRSVVVSTHWKSYRIYARDRTKTYSDVKIFGFLSVLRKICVVPLIYTYCIRECTRFFIIGGWLQRRTVEEPIYFGILRWSLRNSLWWLQYKNSWKRKFISSWYFLGVSYRGIFAIHLVFGNSGIWSNRYDNRHDMILIWILIL